jgi:hypothetical protein
VPDLRFDGFLVDAGSEGGLGIGDGHLALFVFDEEGVKLGYGPNGNDDVVQGRPAQGDHGVLVPVGFGDEGHHRPGRVNLVVVTGRRHGGAIEGHGVGESEFAAHVGRQAVQTDEKEGNLLQFEELLPAEFLDSGGKRFEGGVKFHGAPDKTSDPPTSQPDDTADIVHYFFSRETPASEEQVP